MEYTKKCLESFSAKMNERAKAYGMTHTHFNDASGLNNSSCASDMMKLILNAYPYVKQHKIWGLKEHTLKTEGIDPREIYIYSKSMHHESFKGVSSSYDVRVCKGGTLLTPKIYNVGLIASVPEGNDANEHVACVIMGADGFYNEPNDVYAATKTALDEGMKKYRGEDAEGKYVCSNSAVVYHVAADGKKTLLFEKNPDAIIAPASMSKMMTYILACEYLTDREARVTVTQEVFECLPKNFYQSYLKPGDAVRVYDLIALLMLSSSNLAGYVIAATVGDILLKSKESN